jgi:hypothetical protein
MLRAKRVIRFPEKGWRRSSKKRKVSFLETTRDAAPWQAAMGLRISLFKRAGTKTFT